MTPAGVLFDLGGVLIQLGDLGELVESEGIDGDVFWDRWIHSPAVEAFETGGIDTAEFGRLAVAEFGLDATAEEFVERFSAWPRGFFDGAAELVAEVSQRCITGVVSNTNELHWQTQLGAEQVAGLFQLEFLSFRLGAAKPGASFFEAIIERIDVAPSEFVFLDDNQLNVEAAAKHGFIARRVQGASEARAALLELEIVSGPAS